MTRPLGVSRLVCAALAVVVVPACDREDLVVATFASAYARDASADDGGGSAEDSGAVDAGLTCLHDSECRNDEYCERTGCGPRGVCQVPACVDLGNRAPVCGCDGVTYWNDCERQDHAVSLRGPGICDDDVALPCTTASDCHDQTIPDGYCSIFFVGQHVCDPTASGSCWVLPRDCSVATNDPAFFHPCSAAEGFCETSCTAIRNGDAFSNAEDQCR